MMKAAQGGPGGPGASLGGLGVPGEQSPPGNIPGMHGTITTKSHH